MKTSILLPALLVSATFVAAAGEETKKGPLKRIEPARGLFALTNTNNSVIRNGRRLDLFEYPVSGVTNYTVWRNFEPEQGKFNPAGFNRLLTRAAETDKRLGFALLLAARGPEWVFDVTGCEPFETTRTPNRKGMRDKVFHDRCYLHYIETDAGRVLNEPVLDVIDQTVHSFADIVRAHPDRGHLQYIAMTGWPIGNGLELHLPLKYDPFVRFNFDEKGKRLYIQFCKRIVDIYLDAFPEVPLGIAFADKWGVTPEGDPIRSLEVPRAIVGYALERGRELNAQVIPMGLWMAWTGIHRSEGHPMRRAMRDFQKMGATGIALEGPMGSWKHKNYGTIEEQLDFALEMDVIWAQLWHHDIIREGNGATLEKYNERLRAPRR